MNASNNDYWVDDIFTSVTAPISAKATEICKTVEILQVITCPTNTTSLIYTRRSHDDVAAKRDFLRTIRDQHELV